MVKTPPFHGGNTGSTPVRVTIWRLRSARPMIFIVSFLNSQEGVAPPLLHSKCGCRPMVGLLPSKQASAGSSPVSRSNVDVMELADMAGSNPAGSNLSYGFKSHHRHHSAMGLRVNCNEL